MSKPRPQATFTPTPVAPDAIASLCRLSEQMILTQGALPELREAMTERFLAHEALTRLHLSAISDHKTALLSLLHMTAKLKDAIEELTGALDRIQR